MVTKGKIQIEVKTKDSATKPMKEIGLAAGDMTKKFKVAGAAITAMGVGLAIALGKMITSYAKAGDIIGKMSKATGLSTETLSVLKHMADLSASSIETVGKGALTLQKNIIQASDGMATYTREFDRLGLNIEELLKLSPEEQFFAVTTALAGMENITVRNAAAQVLLGRAGKELLPMLDAGAAGIKEMADEAERSATIFSKEATDAAEDFNDAITNLKAATAKLIAVFADDLMPILTDFIERAKEIIVKIGEWVDAHPDLAKALGIFIGLLTILTVTGGPMLLLIGFIPQIVAGFKALTAFMTAKLIPAIIRVMAAFVAMFASMGPAGWAMILGGVAAAAAGIIALKGLLDTSAGDADLLARSEELGLVPVPAKKGGIFKKPTLTLLGEAGPEAVIPLGASAGGNLGGNTVIINIYGDYMGDESSKRALVRKFKEIMGQDGRRTSFSGINRLEYFSGSSSV